MYVNRNDKTIRWDYITGEGTQPEGDKTETTITLCR
jgi:hypothetical protein